MFSVSDASHYRNTSRRMTELAGPSIQKYLSDTGPSIQGPSIQKYLSDTGTRPGHSSHTTNTSSTKKEEAHHSKLCVKKSGRRHQSLWPGDTRSPRRLSVCESVISETENGHPEPEPHLMSARLRDRRQSTPVMYLTESLNKLALSRFLDTD